jgi:hypothetical protein
MNGIKRESVVAIARAPKERLVDGVLTGMAVGGGLSFGYGAALAEDDFSRGDVAAVAGTYGIAAGAGIGALLDAGFAVTEKPVYIKTAPGLPVSNARHLNLPVPAPKVANWVRGRKVELMLKDGTYLKGAVRGADEQTLELAVRDSSDKSQKGKKLSLPLERISAITYRESIGGNRAAAAVGGALAGLFSGIGLSTAIDYDAADEGPLVAGAAIGVTLGTLTGVGVADHHNSRQVTLSVR